MNEVHVAVSLANSTILNLRKILIGLRSGQEVKTAEIEIVMSRSITDLASLLDYTALLETQLRGLDNRGDQPVA